MAFVCPVPLASGAKQALALNSSFVSRERIASIRRAAPEAPSRFAYEAPVAGLFGGGNKEGGGFGGLGGMANMMKAMQEAQKNAAALQAKLGEERITGEAADGHVKVTVDGKSQPISVSVDDEAVALGAEALSAALEEAWKDAYNRSQEAMKNALMGSLASMQQNLGETPSS
eukprot:tig00001206_g7495.t1